MLPALTGDIILTDRASETFEQIIAKAAQKYGFVVWDKAGAITLRAQNPKSFTKAGQPDPYPQLFNATPAYAILNGMPWDKLQFLPPDWGKSQPGDKPKP